MKISDQHLSITTANDIKEIVKPLFETSDIHYFHYGEIYKKGYSFGFCTHPAWRKYFFEKKLYQFNTDYPANGYHLSAIKNPLPAAHAKKYFNIDHIFTFTKEYADHYMMAGFGTHCGNDKIIDYYLNNRDVLERFILYFKQQADKLIKLSKKEENLIILPEYSGKILKLKAVENRTNFPHVDPYLSLFSKREMDCIKYLLLGNAAREIGEKLFISVRTVETYIENIKNKLGCNKKSEVITKLLKSDMTCFLLLDCERD
jgi:LuxR family quorum-sensing system transcriptional regulator SolR